MSLISPIARPPSPLPGAAFPIELVTADPSGLGPSSAASPPNWFQFNISNGKLWGCINGVWSYINASGGGVVDSVVAGSGVAVDATDPANPVVSTTGGGGSPADPSGAIQFNDSGAFGGFGSWDSSTFLMTLGGSPITPFAGLYVGPDESTLPAVIQGDAIPSQVLITGNLTQNGIGLGIEVAGDSPQGIYAAIVTTGTNTYGVSYLAESHIAVANGIAAGLASFGIVDPGFAADVLYGMDVFPFTVGGGSSLTTGIAFYSQEQTAATNNYYSWFDSQGVRRVKEDSTFDSVGQAIEALYNPQFTKYTPGATDFERVVLGQWNGNVAEIGTEKGGSGTLRDLRLIGNTVKIGGSPITPFPGLYVGPDESTLPATLQNWMTNAGTFIRQLITMNADPGDGSAALGIEAVTQGSALYVVVGGQSPDASNRTMAVEGDAIALANVPGFLGAFQSQVLANGFTVANAVAYYAESNDAGGGTITNNYGLLVKDQNAGTNNWAIKTGLGLVEHDDRVLIAPPQLIDTNYNALTLNVTDVNVTGTFVGPNAISLSLSRNPATDVTGSFFPVGLSIAASTDGTHALDDTHLYGINNVLNHNNTTQLNQIYGNESGIQTGVGAGNIVGGQYGNLGAYGYDSFLVHNGGNIAEFYFYSAGPPIINSPATLTTSYAFWAGDQTGATNPYYSWFDSRGVRRVKEDSTFDSVGQAIEALYNPQFTKYTPGATDFERVVLGQWNGNVAEIGTQAGGSGTLRDLRLIGSNLRTSMAYFTSKNSAPADGDLAANELAMWFDSTNGAAKAMFKGKSANGTVVSGLVVLT